MDNELLEYESPELQHLRFGVIVAGKKHYRIIIARMDTEDYPLVFVRAWDNEPEYSYECWYSLYRGALTEEEADEILAGLKDNNMVKARNLLKKWFKPEGIIIEDVDETWLDDAVPDDWYDAWREMKDQVTIAVDRPGYYEEEINPEKWM